MISGVLGMAYISLSNRGSLMATQPWYQLCILREDVRSGKLTMDEFAADLNDARTKSAPAVYHDPGMFFDRTFATHRMKNLAANVLKRLDGDVGTPVMRLQVAYGGGKTHTLIALLHLAEHGQALADNSTVKAFLTFAGLTAAPQARVALLPGDKIDVKEGLVVFGPNGQTRSVRTLWGALAYQLAGDSGYARLKAHDEDFTVPAEPLLVDLLREPQKDGLGSLVLVDEAVWYYRGLVNSDPRMLGTLKDFYQVLTQAITKVDRAVMVASLIASHIEANDATGTQCLAALEEIFGRIAEPVEPVTRDDVAEILRRRLFASFPTGQAERQPAVDGMMAALNKLPLSENQRDQATYDRFIDSYPFHPELINVLYQKWTQMDNFQRTRGALRLLATALREAEGHDPAPVVGPGVLLRFQGEPGRSELSPALSELVEILSESHKWLASLTGELDKARTIQASLPTMTYREVEQAVIGTFLHSQPIGQRAMPAELLALLAHPDVDAAAIEEGLRKWRERSWFLVENPDVWQLGTVPNLTHMHYQAKNGVSEPEIGDELRKRIKAIPELKSADPGVEVHVLPQSPRDIDDNLRLHYLVLEPACAVTLGQSLPQAAEAYFNEKAGPRIYRNNILALAPEASRVAGLREQVRNWLGWARLERPETIKLLTDEQKRLLPGEKRKTTANLPEFVVGAYNILLSVNENNEIEAQTLPGSVGGHPFERIKSILAEEERLVTFVLDPDLILPGSYLELWGEEQSSQRVSALMEAFGQFPRLPRLLRPESLYDTLKHGVQEGVLVLRRPRPDGTAQTWWHSMPDDDTLRRGDMEVLPASSAALHDLPATLLKPGALVDLWPTESGPLKLEQAHSYFDGVRAPRLIDDDVLETAVRKAVEQGLLMARIDGSNLYLEELPSGALAQQTELHPPPPHIGGGRLTAQLLPEVWHDGKARLSDMVKALSSEFGYDIPWTLIKSAVNEALSLPLFEIAEGSWPCSPAAADEVVFQFIEKITITPDMVVQALNYTDSHTPSLSSVKEAIEQYFLNGRVAPDEDFWKSVTSAVDGGSLTALDAWNAGELSIRVRRPDTVLFGETKLDTLGLERLAEQADDLYLIAQDMNVTFKVSLTLEGQAPDEDTLQRLNEVLEKIQAGWRLS
jgi:hypothetical protein